LPEATWGKEKKEEKQKDDKEQEEDKSYLSSNTLTYYQHSKQSSLTDFL
jgi:hypothetical protein